MIQTVEVIKALTPDMDADAMEGLLILLHEKLQEHEHLLLLEEAIIP